MTGRAEAYYSDYAGTPQELISAVKRGYLYQGQLLRVAAEAARDTRGGPRADVLRELHPEPRPDRELAGGQARPPADQPRPIPGHDGAPAAGARHARCCSRARSSPRRAPSSSSPIFRPNSPSWCGRVAPSSWRSFRASPDPRPRQPWPIRPTASPSSARSSTSRSASATAAAYALHVDLLRLRKEDPVFREQGAGGVDGAVLGTEALVLRFFGAGLDPEDRLLCVNLGRDLDLAGVAEPLLAPPGRRPLAPPLVQRGAPLRRRRHARSRPPPGLATPGPRGPRVRSRSMTDLIRRIPWPNRDLPEQSGWRPASGWSRTGWAGYASGTVSTLMTRRYHGLLIAALPAPLGRMNMLSHLYERLGLPDGGVAATTVGWEASGTGKPAELLDLDGVPPREWPSRLAIRAGRGGPGEAPAAPVPPEHRPRDLSAGLGSRARQSPDPARRPLSPSRAAGERSARRALRSHGPG